MLVFTDSGMLRLCRYNCEIFLGDEVWIYEIPAKDFIMVPINAVINGYEISYKAMKRPIHSINKLPRGRAIEVLKRNIYLL